MFQINQKNCVCCHNCANECPMQAIDYVGTKYQIDTEKCVECGLCAKVCHTQSISDADHPAEITPHPLREYEADVVVCGGGTGLVAAVRAAQQGKKVILVEKARVLGGNTDYAHAYFPVYTNWHKEAGMPDCREDAIEHYVRVTDGILDRDVVRTAVYGCGEFFDWLCTLDDCHRVYELVNLGAVDAHGPIYGPGLITFPNRICDNLNCRDDAIGPGWGGTYVKYTMLKTIQNQKLDVTILLETGAKHLELDETGAISGLVCQDPGGETHIRTKAVILATGGFGKSDEKIAEFAPWFFEGETPIHRFSVPTDTGDGIDMLRELGVEPVPERLNISMFGPKHHPFNNAIADLALLPDAVQVNLNGERWGDESSPAFAGGGSIRKQPKEISWSIGSLSNWREKAEQMIENPAMVNRRWQFETWQEELEEEAKLDTPVKKASTLSGLAEKCGMPAEALERCVERYNRFCENGQDTDFGKPAQFLKPIGEEGPYYAVYGQCFSEAALGGVMVNGDCNAIRADGSIIPGLYGVGDATSAMHIRGRLACISELTWAVASAYTSGYLAAKYVSDKA